MSYPVMIIEVFQFLTDGSALFKTNVQLNHLGKRWGSFQLRHERVLKSRSFICPMSSSYQKPSYIEHACRFVVAVVGCGGRLLVALIVVVAGNSFCGVVFCLGKCILYVRKCGWSICL